MMKVDDSLSLYIYLLFSLPLFDSLSLSLSIYLIHSLSLSLSLSGFHFFCNRISTVRYLMSVRNTTREETHPQVSQLHHRTTAMAAKFRLHEECSLKSTIFLKKFVFLISFFFFFFSFFHKKCTKHLFNDLCSNFFFFFSLLLRSLSARPLTMWFDDGGEGILEGFCSN